MNIEPNEFMAGKVDAEARLPRRSTTAAYNSGYAAGLAARADGSDKRSVEFVTITGMKIFVASADVGATWTVSTPDNQVHTGSALDVESGVAHAEGCIRQLGHPPVRMSHIEARIRQITPTLPAAEVSRLSGRVVAYIKDRKGI